MLLEQLAGRYTRLLLSYNPEIGMIYTESSKRLSTSRIEKTDSSIVKINKDGDYFTLRIEDNYLCSEKSVLKPCKKPSLLIFEEMPRGYRIMYSYKCLTSGTVVKFTKCDSDDKKQIFVFDLDSSLYCSNDGEKPYSIDEDGSFVHKLPLTTDQKLMIMEKEFAKLGITDPNMKKGLRKAWTIKSRRFPKFSWCGK